VSSVGAAVRPAELCAVPETVALPLVPAKWPAVESACKHANARADQSTIAAAHLNSHDADEYSNCGPVGCWGYDCTVVYSIDRISVVAPIDAPVDAACRQAESPAEPASFGPTVKASVESTVGFPDNSAEQTAFSCTDQPP